VSRPRDGLVVTDHRIPVDGATIRARQYRPRVEGPLPAHVYLHGGAFWTGGLDDVDRMARQYARSVPCAVFSVEYRLAPEHPFPEPLADCYAVLEWVSGHRADLGVSAVSVGGTSAGGNLAAALALLSRDRGGPAIAFQLLEQPTTDLTGGRPSLRDYRDQWGLTAHDLFEGYGFYAPDAATRREGYASPLLAADLSGLPPAFVLVNEFDPLHDDGVAYADRLRAAGVPVRVITARGHVHGSLYGAVPLSGRRYRAELAAALREALAP
jgi:acetyl esterase